MQRQLKVVFFPYGLGEENPYQKLLVHALEINNIEVIKLPGRKIFPLWQILKHKPDIVHLFWPHDMYLSNSKTIGLLKRLMLKFSLFILAKQPTVYAADNLLAHESFGLSKTDELKIISGILNKCSGIVFTSNAGVQIFNSTHLTKVKKQLVIPHISLSSAYPNNVDQPTARKHLGLSDKFTFLVFGRIDSYKGLEDIIKAFQQFSESGTQLVIAGKCSDPNYASTINEQIQKSNHQNITFVNTYIANNEMQNYMNAADVVILNYKDVPLNPGSLILAADFNKTIIAPAHPIICEIGANLDLITFEPENIEQLADAMETTFSKKNKPSTPNTLNNSPKETGNALMNFYKTLLSDKKRYVG
jgi:beta-1,4-mannosyltransferase